VWESPNLGRGQNKADGLDADIEIRPVGRSTWTVAAWPGRDKPARREAEGHR
jgi:hypothetical protein